MIAAGDRGPGKGSLLGLGAAGLRDLFVRGEASALEIATACLDRIARVEPGIGAFLTVDAEGAQRQARLLDDRRAAGAPAGILAAVPVAIKDVLCVRGMPTTCGSRILKGFFPPYDATCVERLRAAGAVIVGKANMDEFAMGSSTEHSAYGRTRNPWDGQRVPGGSSGGSAAAVAAREVPLSLGSDTGGSIRQPAAFTGTVGLKPTYGRVSRYGLVAFASSLDQVGPFARSVQDAALALQAMAGADPRDSTCSPVPVEDYAAAARTPASLEGLRVGVPAEFMGEGLDPEIQAAVERCIALLRDQGARVVEVPLPHSRHAIAAYYVVATAEASSNLARYDGVRYGARAADAPSLGAMYRRTRAEGFGAEVKRRIMLGTYALSAGYYDAYYLKAMKVRTLIRRDFELAFRQADVLLGPTTPSPAFRFGEKLDDPLSMYLSDIYTVTANLAGIPGLSLPCGFTRDGLPIGCQLLGRFFGERALLSAAAGLEAALRLQAPASAPAEVLP
ncbi:MAG TPA: Asp-tRNA(Asn)/Glu-tRNA(Gln) amidotransferase subunit GatA [Candidatus Polarisedimenticolia bacterium]|nr:Asp-tRNA(Asn)/Glu-tRNA(Gln) amidotransferase subunit GatA [Candidatus Polarisedimenticolia bacterium]